MDDWNGLAVPLWLGLIAAFVLSIVALVRGNSVQQRLDFLEAELRRLHAFFATQRAAVATPDSAPALAPATELAPTSSPPETVSPAPGEEWQPAPALEPLAASSGAPPFEGIATSVPEAAAQAPARSGLELKLGGGLFVWVGGIALALAALFLVRYAIDQGYLSPLVRVVLTTLFGFALIAGAEWMRPRDARIAQALAAAGVASLFGALFAAVALYHLVPRLAGGLLGFALTAGAISLALRHGVFVAALGLVGGVISPAVIGSDTPNIPLLLGYLLAISAGTLAVIRHRGWWWLGWGVLAGSTLWSLAWLLMREFSRSKHQDDLVFVGLFQVALAGLFVWATWQRIREQREMVRHVAIKVAVAMAVTGLVLVLCIAGQPARFEGWLALALHAAAIYALARFVPHYQWLAIAPPILSLMAFLSWHGPRHFDIDFADAEPFARTIAAMGVLLAGGALGLMWNAGRPGFWAGLSAATALLHFLLAYAALRHSMPEAIWGAISLALALPYLIAAERLARWRTAMPGATEALGFAAVGVVGFVAAAVPLELRREWITVAYALSLPLVAWISWKLDLPILRRVCWAIVATVAVRLVINPSLLDYPLGSIPLLNWILYTYGIAAVSFWVAARFLEQHAEDPLTAVVDAGAVLFLFLLASLEIRSLFHPEGLGARQVLFFERAAYVAVWGGLAVALLYHDSVAPSMVRAWAWRLIGGLALFSAVVVQALLVNPVFVGGKVGALPVLNGLLLAYALPAVLAGLATWRLVRSSDLWARGLAGGSAVFLAFVWISSEIRHIFHPQFGGNPLQADGAELYLYSVAWLLFGASLLGFGLWRNLAVARHAGMAVVWLAVCKAFLVDMAGLEQLWRVFSFLGLGAVLLALAYFYRRIAFTTPAEPAPRG